MTQPAVAALINVHLTRYPEMEIMDVYRLLHQAVFGTGHPVKAVKAEREWLEREVEITQPDASHPLLESVHPEGKIVRLHLRPYLAAKGEPRMLLDAYIDSCKVVTGSADEMAAYWQAFQILTQAKTALADHFDSRSVTIFGRTRAVEHYPASHHSPPILQRYRPVYRVMLAALAQQMLNKQKIIATII
jgi:hypothetical protein